MIKRYNRKVLEDDEQMFGELAQGKKSTFVSDRDQRDKLQRVINEQVTQRLIEMKKDFDQRGLKEFFGNSKNPITYRQEID